MTLKISNVNSSVVKKEYFLKYKYLVSRAVFSVLIPFLSVNQFH